MRCRHASRTTESQTVSRSSARRGCEEFEQRAAALRRRRRPSVATSARDEVLYVLAGSGAATIGGDAARARARHRGVYVARGHGVARRRRADGSSVLSVLVRRAAARERRDARGRRARRGERGGATAGREFRLLATPEVGCASVTQFVGYIPRRPRARPLPPLRRGRLRARGRRARSTSTARAAPLRRGSCVHLPARLVHCLENVGPGEMQVLGVFRPAGSPAEAYYPDGTAAAVPAEA